MSVDVQQITGTPKSVRKLLKNKRYGLEFYQREYSWNETQVEELINDLAACFLEEFEESHERKQVASHRPYFLGPIVTVKRDGIRYLVDGQQRITTLTLMLIYFRQCLAEECCEESVARDSLIFTSSYGQKTFNLDVPERQQCLEAIVHGYDFDHSAKPASVRNLWERYQTIVDCFPDDLGGAALPYFTDWLQHRVILVEIGTPDSDMALEIFETMNDRGLRLTNTDMLKSYLLARVGEDSIQELNRLWRSRVKELVDSEENADSAFIRAWLRGKYAETQRQRKARGQRKANASGDFENIGRAFHKWVRDDASRAAPLLGLRREADYRRFVARDFLGLSQRYIELLRATQSLQPEFESVYFNANIGTPLQLSVILAALTPEDDDASFREKTALVAKALDIFVARRIVNYRNFGYSTVVYTMFNLMKEIRDQPIDAVRQVLADWLEKEDERLNRMSSFALGNRNRYRVRYLLARLTAWLDAELGHEGTFVAYVDRSRHKRFEIEHIWANHFDHHAAEFDNSFDFGQHRNKLGGLLLLPKDFNASYGDMAYEQKVEHYNSQNPLARSLHPMAYENNPSFLRLCETYELPFKPYPSSFAKSAIDERQELYRALAEIIWDPARHGLA